MPTEDFDLKQVKT
jgi:hypothetical protein